MVQWEVGLTACKDLVMVSHHSISGVMTVYVKHFHKGKGGVSYDDPVPLQIIRDSGTILPQWRGVILHNLYSSTVGEINQSNDSKLISITP
jgi:hypothetical protein